MKKLFGGRKQDKSEQAARAGRWGGTHAAEQRAGAQAGAHDGGGGSGARGAEGRGGARAAGSARAPGAPVWPRPAPDGPAPAPPRPTWQSCSRFSGAGALRPPGTHLGRCARRNPGGKVGGAVPPAAARAGQPDRAQAGARVLVPSEGLEILRPGFESG